MSNELTGSFEAVVQVSGRTVNRLLASLHQNVYSGKPLPTALSHTAMRLGDAGFYGATGGVRGKVWAQIGAPSMELIDGATDEVWIEAPVRAHFAADPATAAFPEFIFGRVRAKYRLAAVPWSGARLGAGRLTLLRLDVDPETISFTSFDDPFADPQITEQVRVVVQRRVVVRPHPLLDDFKASRFRSLVAPGGEAAVCHPLGPSAQNPAARIDSIRTLFLGGRDLAVAVSREYVLAMIQPSLDALKATPHSFPVTVKMNFLLKTKIISTTYTVTLSTASAEWSPLPPVPIFGLSPVGSITLTIQGTATTNSILPNASFSITHDLQVLFDPASETLSVATPTPSVSVDVNGPFGFLIRNLVEPKVTAIYNAAVATALSQVAPKLQGTLAQKQQLITQLKTLDDQADAHFDAVESSPHGFVLRGSIGLSPRHMMAVQVDKLADGSGYTALRSWIPGGHVDEYQWRWYFTTAPISTGMPPDGAASYADRFLLQSAAPVPGIPLHDGSGNPPKIVWGQICLVVRGRVLDAVTGHEMAVDNVSGPWRERQCMYVVPAPPVPPTTTSGAITRRPRLWWTLWLAGTGAATGAADERVAAHVELSAPGREPFNALVQFVGEPADLDSLAELAEGVRAAGRPDAGLLVLVVLREGFLGRGGAEITARLTAFVQRLDVPPIVTEDAQGGWSMALGVPSAGPGAVTSLIDAAGVAAWVHEGPLDAAALAAVLRERLTPCPPPAAEPVELSVRSGDPAPGFFVETATGQWTEVQALRGRPVILAFVQPWARPCIAQLRRLQRLQEQHERTGTMTVAIVDGVGAEEARAFARRHGLTFAVSADRDGEIRRRYGIRVWPTTVVVDERGRVAGVDLGADAGALAALAREPEWAALRPPLVTRT